MVCEPSPVLQAVLIYAAMYLTALPIVALGYGFWYVSNTKRKLTDMDDPYPCREDRD